MLLLAVTVSVANVLFAAGVDSLPLSDQGPHIHQGWDQVVRLRHLYAARPGLHLLISDDGQIHGSADQTLYSLLEIRPVDPGCVAIRGVATARFLCIQGDGRLYSSHTYSKDDCTFREHILPDGYNIYISDTQGALLSLGNQRQRLQGRDRGVPALAQTGEGLHVQLSYTWWGFREIQSNMTKHNATSTVSYRREVSDPDEGQAEPIRCLRMRKPGQTMPRQLSPV
ncbi:putative fibroblast growth factor 19 [Scophthalmus maximus]|uniref:Fibroblast growth factor n=1 Tax=Scophthalmus maximus TaxID=52904 RepID=A0A2U9BDQ9_SCOMX|nr:putative fibroblast growth factor 19 [Scophthalmus maximus]